MIRKFPLEPVVESVRITFNLISNLAAGIITAILAALITRYVTDYVLPLGVVIPANRNSADLLFLQAMFGAFALAIPFGIALAVTLVGLQFLPCPPKSLWLVSAAIFVAATAYAWLWQGLAGATGPYPLVSGLLFGTFSALWYPISRPIFWTILTHL